MRIFDKENGFESKVNFVDKNNRFVGFDMSQDCCEHADWFISKDITPYDSSADYENVREDLSLSEYVFDVCFFKEVESDSLDEGGQVVFKLVNESNVLYLHLFNSHNGYYSHGFEFKNGDKIIKEGRL